MIPAGGIVVSTLTSSPRPRVTRLQDPVPVVRYGTLRVLSRGAYCIVLRTVVACLLLVVAVVVQAVDDDFTRSASSGVGGMVGEATTEAEHRVIEELGPKRRLLMAVNESKANPVREGGREMGDKRDNDECRALQCLGSLEGWVV